MKDLVDTVYMREIPRSSAGSIAANGLAIVCLAWYVREYDRLPQFQMFESAPPKYWPTRCDVYFLKTWINNVSSFWSVWFEVHLAHLVDDVDEGFATG